MEVGHQGIHQPEPVTRIDKDIRLALPGLQTTGLAGRFQRPQCGRSNRHHPATPGMGLGHLLNQGIGDLVTLTVHVMVFHLVHAHRLERPCSYMEGDKTDINPVLLQGRQHRIVKMQAGGRGRHSAGFAGIDRLVALHITILIRAVDIRRQRHMADFLQCRQQGVAALARQRELQDEQGVTTPRHLGTNTLIKFQPTSRFR